MMTLAAKALCPHCREPYDPEIRKTCPACLNSVAPGSIPDRPLPARSKTPSGVMRSPLAAENVTTANLRTARVREPVADPGPSPVRAVVPDPPDSTWWIRVSPLAGLAMFACFALGVGLTLAMSSVGRFDSRGAGKQPGPTVQHALIPIGGPSGVAPGDEGRFEILSLVREPGGQGQELAVLTLRNTGVSTVRELLVQLIGVDGRGRAYSTPSQAVPLLVGGGRSVEVRITVPEGGELRQVRAQHWSQSMESISVEEYRLRRRRAEELQEPLAGTSAGSSSSSEM